MTDAQLRDYAAYAQCLVNPCQPSAMAVRRLLAEVTRLRAERDAIEAECRRIARQPIGHHAGEVMTKVLALFSPKETT